ncbi:MULTISPECIES: hypothetical protein [unclassified Lysobacter]
MQTTARAAVQTRPANIDELIRTIQLEFPDARIRITGRARTIRRQAELMAQRIRVSRGEFLTTYRMTRHITEMDEWFRGYPRATETETVDAFEALIEQARARGAQVSNHLSNTARDISWPSGSHRELDLIEARIQELGASVLREPRAAGGRHWHVDW